MVLVDKRQLTSVRYCCTYQGLDIGSDHSLVMCKFQIRLICEKKKELKQKLNIESLKDGAFTEDRCRETFSQNLMKLRNKSKTKLETDTKSKHGFQSYQPCNNKKNQFAYF